MKHMTQVKTISSSMTFIMKVLFPTVWILGFGFGTLCLWLNNKYLNNGFVPSVEAKLALSAAWAVGTTLILWTCARLKKIRMDTNHLYISNYLKEITVPVSSIKKVQQNLFLNIQPVSIYFCDATAFGERVVFIPTHRFAIWRLHPIVAELNHLAGLKV